MQDSRGKKSKTLLFVTTAFVTVTAKFIAAGATIGTFGTQPNMTASEYGIAVGIVLGIWLGREWTEKK